MHDTVLDQILQTLAELKTSQQTLSLKVDKLQIENHRQQSHPLLHSQPKDIHQKAHQYHSGGHSDSDGDTVVSISPSFDADHLSEHLGSQSVFVDKPILTTYPDQPGAQPAHLKWGASTPKARGPIIVSRHPSSIGHRNAIGAYAGPYSIYRALAVAMGDVSYDHKPNFTNTQPPITIKQQPQWSDPTKIVAMDPFGHLPTEYFKNELAAGEDIRPTISITRAHMVVPEIANEVRDGTLRIDGNVIVNKDVEINVHKAAIDPVWYLPGVAERLKVDEEFLRRSLFEVTGGMYPELMTRPDIKVFLPPIGGLTVYIFGDHEKLSDPNTRLTVRVHDECNGSDVFGSDICTCRPYLIYGMREAIREAQDGGVGLLVYFRKEGRALGEVTKYLVYNARKRGGDTAETYFMRTENIAGVKDMRFQALMPDVFHWLGITKIDRFMSMSNMKHDALVDAGIKILERCPIPDELIPKDSKVEMDAKIAAGYFTTGHIPRQEELCQTVGRGWESF
ncbi:Uracil-regulated protein 1 [Actinomortierella ambigua]|uniref:Uracil-regulated protein 1 n=1 Tax=Actinomortierella ambigua TaxID=1343610 RepID=A0A9P6PYN6_9FUNG|nr:Uracil-regulated protein 1 [Actinomortierella ambigua]